jgi:hypothetical protein
MRLSQNFAAPASSCATSSSGSRLTLPQRFRRSKFSSATSRCPAPIGGADLFSVVTGLCATLLPGVDAHADHWLALHACVFGAVHDVQFEIICAPRDAGASVLQLRSLLPSSSTYPSPAFVIASP